VGIDGRELRWQVSDNIFDEKHEGVVQKSRLQYYQMRLVESSSQSEKLPYHVYNINNIFKLCKVNSAKNIIFRGW